ncbi:MAG: hypothetical protein IPK60_25635 [Sandaracinaceae bacterium]|nr:hypothetical protein [Sandaracinaceae bacterium]
MRLLSQSIVAGFALLLLACSNDPDVTVTDAGSVDAATNDAGTTDSGALEAGSVDAGMVDGTTPADLGSASDAATDLGSSVDASIDGGTVTCGYQDALGEGACALFLGYAWDGESCYGISGCTCEGADCGNLYESPESCEDAYAPCSASCGGLLGTSCPSGAFCDYAIEDMCGATDALGTCSPITDGCLDVWDPVCGCDGMTYSNTCYAAREGVGVYSEGECAAEPS